MKKITLPVIAFGFLLSTAGFAQQTPAPANPATPPNPTQSGLPPQTTQPPLPGTAPQPGTTVQSNPPLPKDGLGTPTNRRRLADGTYVGPDSLNREQRKSNRLERRRAKRGDRPARKRMRRASEA